MLSVNSSWRVGDGGRSFSHGLQSSSQGFWGLQLKHYMLLIQVWVHSKVVLKHLSYGTTGCVTWIISWFFVWIAIIRFLVRRSHIVLCLSYGLARCTSGKLYRQHFPVHTERTRVPASGLKFHRDLCGPMQVPSLGGVRYYVAFKDD